MSGQTADPFSNKRSQDQLGANYYGVEEDGMAKKARVGETAPSKVLHARNLPPDCTEPELIAVACPFGRVANVLLLKGKNQAFIEMQDQTAATTLINYYNSVQANIRSKPVYFQYSNREEISAPSVVEEQNNILLVTVMNVLYPVTIETLHQIFSKYGTILKIIIFSKTDRSGSLQSLIQFADITSAAQAKSLDGQNIYNGCCTLKIQFSTLKNLNVKYNNEKSRDYTNPSLPTSSPGGMGVGITDPAAIWSPSYLNQTLGIPTPGGMTDPNKQMGMSGTPAVLIVSGLHPERCSPDILFTLFGVYGDVIRVKILYNKKDTALIQMANSQQAETAVIHLNNCPLHGKTIQVNFSRHASISLPRAGSEQESSHLTKDYTGSPLHRYKVAGSKNYQHITAPSPILHLSNLPQNATEELITDIFSQYGNVASFKFFEKDKRMALVQMENLADAVECLVMLHNYRIGETNIRVSFSQKPVQ